MNGVKRCKNCVKILLISINDQKPFLQLQFLKEERSQ